MITIRLIDSMRCIINARVVRHSSGDSSVSEPINFSSMIDLKEEQEIIGAI